jgi:hypothetical protein
MLRTGLFFYDDKLCVAAAQFCRSANIGVER